MAVVVEIVGHRVVGDHQVHPSIVVDIHKHRSKAVVTLGIGNSGSHADVGEGTIPIIVEEVILLSGQTTRSTHHIDAAEFTEARRDAALPGNRRMVSIKLYVSGNKQIQQAIVVVVAPGGPSRPATQGYSCFL